MDAEERNRGRDTGRLAEFVLVAASAGVYLFFAGPHVLGGDNGEFGTAISDWILPHPPGYPLYVIYLRLLSWLPASSPAHAAALATALLGAGACWASLVAARNWGASRPAALIATALVASSPLTIIASSHAEVFALNWLLAAALLAGSGPEAARQGSRRLCVIAVLAGLGLGNHHSIVFVFPAVLWGVYRAVREGARLGAFALAGAAFILALVLPYAVVLLAVKWTSSPWVWGDIDSFGGIVHHFLRGDYGTGKLGLVDHGGTAAEHIALLGRHLFGQCLYLGLPLALLGLLDGLRSGDRGRRIALSCLLISLLASGPLFVCLFNLGTSGIDVAIVKRFHLLPLVVSTPLMAFGLQAIFSRIRAPLARYRPALPGAVAVVIVAQSMIAAPDVQEHHRPSIEFYLRNTLASLPENAVLLATGDHRQMGILYLQNAVGLRPDVVVVNPNLLTYPWYAERIRARLEVDITGAAGGNVNTRVLAREIMGAGRPLFMANRFSRRFVTTFALYPRGTVWGVVEKGTRLDDPYRLEEESRELFSSFQLEAEPPRDPTTWAYLTVPHYVDPWLSFAGMFERLGDTDKASECRSRAWVFRHGLPPETEPRQP